MQKLAHHQVLWISGIIILIITVAIKSFLNLESFAESTPSQQQQQLTVSPTIMQAMQQHSGVEPCQTLFSRSLEPTTRMIASDYIDTKRFKKWKPKEKSNISSEKNIEYCYINNDISNGTQDYMMSKRTCDTNNPLIQHVPFILDAFPDNVIENTQLYPNKKCVFKIDKSKVNQQDLSYFWGSNVGPSDCIQKNAYITELYDTLLNEQSLLKMSESELRSKLQQMDVMISEQAKRKQQLEEETSSCRQMNESLNTYLRQTLEERDQLRTAFQNNETECVQREVKLRNDTQDCNQNLATMKEMHKNITIDHDKLKRKHADLQSSYSSVRQSLQSLQLTHNKLVTNHQALNTDYDTKQKELGTCSIARKECYSQLEQCMPKLAELQKEVATLIDTYNTCDRNRAECNNKLGQCHQDVANLSQQIQQYKDQLTSCNQSLETCKTQQASLNVTIDDQNREIEELRKRSKPECDRTKIQVANLQQQRAAVMTQCEEIQSNAIATKMQYDKLAQDLDTEMKADINRCHADRDKIEKEKNKIIADVSIFHGDMKMRAEQEYKISFPSTESKSKVFKEEFDNWAQRDGYYSRECNSVVIRSKFTKVLVTGRLYYVSYRSGRQIEDIKSYLTQYDTITFSFESKDIDEPMTFFKPRERKRQKPTELSEYEIEDGVFITEVKVEITAPNA
jgi:DNA repair exonuclease SbcCD ATPase subunit